MKQPSLSSIFFQKTCIFLRKAAVLKGALGKMWCLAGGYWCPRPFGPWVRKAGYSPAMDFLSRRQAFQSLGLNFQSQGLKKQSRRPKIRKAAFATRNAPPGGTPCRIAQAGRAVSPKKHYICKSCRNAPARAGAAYIYKERAREGHAPGSPANLIFPPSRPTPPCTPPSSFPLPSRARSPTSSPLPSPTASGWAAAWWCSSAPAATTRPSSPR